jgi:hypothetical protein
MEDPMETKKTLRKPMLLVTLLLTAISLSACVIPADRGDRGGHHHWNNDRNWSDDDTGWRGHHGNWNGDH